MADRNRKKPRKPKPDFMIADEGIEPTAMVDAARMAAVIRGCTCDVEVTYTGPDGYGGHHVSVAHDDWCPVIASAQAEDN